MSDFADGYFELDGIRLHFVEKGSGPLMIFYHGFPSFWLSFHRQMTAFAEDYRVVAVDGLGANLSSKPDDLSSYRVSALARQIDELARHLAGEDRFTLVGHDWGGALAWTYAQAYPERLDKVIVMSAPPTNQLLALLQCNEEQREKSAYMFAIRSGRRHRLLTENNSEWLWERAYERLRVLPHFGAEEDERFRQALAVPGAVDAGINWYRANVPDDIADADLWPSRDARTPVPGLLIWGETDGTFVREFIDGLEDYVDNLQVCLLEGIGHWPMIEAPEQVNDAMRAFLSGQQVNLHPVNRL